MLRARVIPVFGACLVGALGFVYPVTGAAQDLTAAGADGRLGDVLLPGGLRAMLAAIRDQSAPDRSQFLVEAIRRTHHSPLSPNGVRTDILVPMLAHLNRWQATSEAARGAAGPPDTLPLPLPMKIWTDTVFSGQVKPDALVAAILRTRNAALLYVGALSLDEPTRAWLATQPKLIALLVKERTAAFTFLAPALRVANGRVDVPGGEPAVAAWEALVGQKVTQPAAFIRALVDGDARHLPYFYGMLASLTPPQMQMLLRLDAPDGPTRIAAVQRLHAVADRIAAKWQIESRAFWRPSYDPALLVGDLRVGEDGRPQLPGTRLFWQAVFTDIARHEPQQVLGDEAADLVWLSEQVFDGPANGQQRRYTQVLFASRLLPMRLTADQVPDAIEAVRAAGRFPALVRTLERVHVTDLAVIAAAARRAGRLAEIDDEDRAVHVLAQFQGALALVTRAAWRGSLSADAVKAHILALSAIDVAKDETYDGRVVRWLDTIVPAAHGADDISGGALEHELLSLVAGHPLTTRPGTSGPSTTVPPRVVVWEGTRYRVDLAAAEAARMERVRGEAPRPYLSSARALVRMADALDARSTNATPGGATSATLRDAADLLGRVATAVGWPDGANWENHGATARYRTLAAALPKQGSNTTSVATAGAAMQLRVLGDDLLARGLTELVYATALGQPADVGISADEAAVHHDFGMRASGVRYRYGPWQLPMTNADSRRDSQARGSLLGLDVSLAPLSLVRMSSKLPPRRPTLNEDDRRAMTHAIAVVEEAPLLDADRDAIAAALRRGRERLAAVKTSQDAWTLGHEIGLSGMRRSLLAWVVERDRERLAAFLAPSELFWLGLEGKPVDARLGAWGAPGEPRTGCLCLQLIDRRPWEMFAGRWGTGILISAFPDLNLRIAELLAELRMPAALLGPVLTSATLEFVNTVDSRDPDDRRGLAAFVNAMTPERMELYLALLTTDGPLVPLGKTGEGAAMTGAPR